MEHGVEGGERWTDAQKCSGEAIHGNDSGLNPIHLPPWPPVGFLWETILSVEIMDFIDVRTYGLVNGN